MFLSSLYKLRFQNEIFISKSIHFFEEKEKDNFMIYM